MAQHNFACPACGFIERDVNIPIALGASSYDTVCPHCGDAKLEWIPQIGRMSAGNGPTFTSFETLDGRNRPVRVSSISDLRRIEKDSESMARNGEGQIMVWRDYSNDRSNKYDSAIHGTKWHDHPEPVTYTPTRSGDDIAERQAEPGAQNTNIVEGL